MSEELVVGDSAQSKCSPRALTWMVVPSGSIWSASNHLVQRESLGQDGDHDMMVQPDTAAARDFDEVSVPAGHYLVLRDNRDNSSDSRYIGFISREAFIGRATHVVASFNPDHWLLPRG